MASHIGRRKFLAALGGAAAAWPLAARAQQPGMPVIGFLNGASPEGQAPLVAAFHQGLKESGFIESQNVAIEYRWAHGQYDRLPALAADLARRRVALIAATGGTVSALAAKAATATIPIVFTSGGDDPVAAGLVASLNRPGGNATGLTLATSVLAGKRLEIARELVSGNFLIAFLVNPNNPNNANATSAIRTTAVAYRQEVEIFRAVGDNDLDAAFAAVVRAGARALVVEPDPFFDSQRVQMIVRAARHAVPTVFGWREHVLGGGLTSYGPNLPDAYRQVGVYAGLILKGAKPAELPVQQPTKFELIINLKTARTLGIDIPPTLLARADEVIE
jgi:putative tryptophan/tyrosine transport system substrate-binding protein